MKGIWKEGPGKTLTGWERFGSLVKRRREEKVAVFP